MGYQIFTHVRLETLVESQQALFQSRFLDERPMIVLQSQSLAQWLKLFLARHRGGYVTGDFVFQDEALRRLIALSGRETGRVLFLDDLKFALYRQMTAAWGEGSNPVLAPLKGRGSDPDAVRTFELADHIAGVFHHYAMNSNLWPLALSNGLMPLGTGADPATFAWQSLLWRNLEAQGQGTLAGLALERLTREPPPPRGEPARLVLVGSAFLSRRAAAFLRAWSDAGLVDVTQLLLLPAPPPQTVPWPQHRPWSSWGAFGKAFLQSLPPTSLLSASADPVAKTALSILQSSLSSGQSIAGIAPDETLEIHSSPHAFRELEVLRDRLLCALEADPELEMNDIAVLAPDINLYAPLLEAAFGSQDPGRNLRFHVIDLDLGKENAWFRALDALLALVSGSIDRPHLFSLVETSAFQEAWSLEAEERELWLDYTETVSAWLEGPEAGQQSWTSSWDRLFEGWFRSEPLDTSGSSFRLLGRFHELLFSLGSMHQETNRPRSFQEWIRFFEALLAKFLGTGEGTAALLCGRLRTLVVDAGSPQEAFPWSGFRAFVQDQIAHFPGRRGQLLTEGVHCSSLRPLRAIPFKVIAMIGLDEGRFPRQGTAPSFDLSIWEAGQEEVSYLSLERYTFWEAIMAARSRLILSFHGQSPTDGSQRPPSPLLADLLDYLEVSGVAYPVIEASVKDFSTRAAPLPTWSPRSRRRAEAFLGISPPPNLAQVPSPVDLTESFPEVRTADVLQAFTTPARFHLRRVRQIRLRDEDNRSADDQEPWSLTFLDRQAWLREGLRRDLAGQPSPWDVDGFVDQSVASGLVRPGVFSDRDRRQLRIQAGLVAAWASQLRDEGWELPEPVPAVRTLWSGRPWAPDPPARLVRGKEVLSTRLLYAKTLPMRNSMEECLLQLLDPSPNACLATLNLDGEHRRARWGPDAETTRQLIQRAEHYWGQTVATPLPFYPDFLEAVALERKANPDEPWVSTTEKAWLKVKDPGFTLSDATLGTDPYVALAFSQDPTPQELADGLEPWWRDLFLPLLEAWQWE